MTTNRKSGIGILLLGIMMFVFGVYMFTYRGSVSPIISKMGMYCFFLWLPTIITGIVMIFMPQTKK
jgi:hypothetical protein